MWLRKGVKILAILYTLFIVYASLGKYMMQVIPKDINGGDKIAHFGAYAVFVIVWVLSISLNTIRDDRGRYLKYIVLSGLVLGFLMEICQYVFTSYRQMDWLDMVANSVGILIGYLVSVKFMRLS